MKNETEEEKKERAKQLMAVIELNQSGYAGMLPNGNIVDRRVFPEAIPIQANPLFNVTKPKKP